MHAELTGFQKLVLEALDRLMIAYAVTGSVASAHYGKPRSTVDIDIVVDPDREQLRMLVTALEKDAMADGLMAEEAFQHRTMFNIISYETLEKVDLIFLRQEEFELEAFSRRITVEVSGHPVNMLTAEDIILSKLRWRKESQSERQLEDVVTTMVLQWRDLDWDYIERWVLSLNLQEGLELARGEAEARLK